MGNWHFIINNIRGQSWSLKRCKVSEIYKLYKLQGPKYLLHYVCIKELTLIQLFPTYFYPVSLIAFLTNPQLWVSSFNPQQCFGHLTLEIGHGLLSTLLLKDQQTWCHREPLNMGQVWMWASDQMDSDHLIILDSSTHYCMPTRLSSRQDAHKAAT